MQGVYGAAHDTTPLQAAALRTEPALRTEGREKASAKALTLQEFAAALQSGFPAFDVMHEVTAAACAACK